MRQRVIVGTKLAETAARGVFMLVCLYRLPVVEAGQFGLAATLVGIAAFVLGYERHVDLLRETAGHAEAAVRRSMQDALRFFAVHAAWVLPLFALLVTVVSSWPPLWVMSLVLIALAEHLSNQGYIAALLDRRHYALLAAVAVKNIALAVGIAAVAVLAPSRLDLSTALYVWAASGALYLVAAAALWQARRPAGQIEPANAVAPMRITDQYRRCRLLFGMGLVALAALQIDRLIAGALLTPFDIGIYFRNVTLAGLALQLFAIVSFNRVAPGVYQHAREGDSARAHAVVRTEYRRFAVVLMLSSSIALAAGVGWPGRPLAALHIEPRFVMLLGVAVLLRAAADYAGLLLLAFAADNHLLRNQLVAVALGALVLALAAWRFGLVGAVCGALVTPLTYFVLNRASLRRLS
jgi:hypothetical protein